ncbi:hypothetical protein F4V89_29385 [Neorhizobium galegae]|nr:hypothetical protein F4V89_29385 [Neorhizobium galegae]
MLQHKDRPEDLDTISDADFFKMFWRLNNLALPLICFAHIVSQPKERAFFVFHNRRALIHVMDDFMQPSQGRIVSDEAFLSIDK